MRILPGTNISASEDTATSVLILAGPMRVDFIKECPYCWALVAQKKYEAHLSIQHGVFTHPDGHTTELTHE